MNNNNQSHIQSIKKSHIKDLSKLQKIKDIFLVAKFDFINSKFAGKVIVAGLVVITVYEWGPGNETFIPLVTGQVLDKANGILGILLTAVVSGGFVFFEQILAGYFAYKTVLNYQNLSKRVFLYFGNPDDSEYLKHKKYFDLPFGRKFIYTFFLGASFNVLREAFLVNSTDKKNLIKIVRFNTCFNALLVATIGGIIDLVNQCFYTNQTFQNILGWTLKNPIFWIVVMTIYFIFDHYSAKQKYKKFNERHNQPLPTE